MSEQAHTPGPWFEDEAGICADSWGVVGQANYPESYWDRGGIEMTAAETAEHAANSRLIAAAPDLLAFAEAHDAYMSKHYADGPDGCALHPDAAANWKACRAAIERASAAGRSEPTPTEAGGRG